eukprot:4761734-Amphidinium_carterae.1
MLSPAQRSYVRDWQGRQNALSCPAERERELARKLPHSLDLRKATTCVARACKLMLRLKYVRSLADREHTRSLNVKGRQRDTPR